ncbi:MAG: BLUF domain-containing protein [Hyphomonas sp.]
MTQGLFRLVYVSTARAGLTEADIEDILDASQSNNDERYITGYLVHNGPSFMQLIEGPRAEVDEIFRRILADARHTGVVRILAEWCLTRAFPEWSMNYFRVDRPGSVGSMIARREDPVDSLMAANAPRDLIHLFSKFIQQADYAEADEYLSHAAGRGRRARQQDPRE